MILYTCEKCHKWQDVSIGIFLTNTWNNAMKSIPDAKIPEPVGYPCPNGCGQMTLVNPDDKISIKEETHSTARDPLWEVVKELVEKDSVATYETMDCEPCPFCTGVNNGISNFHHDETCVIAKARRLVWYKQEKTFKKQETYCFGDAIGEARRQQGYSLPLVITNGEIIARCQVNLLARYILFKNKECIGIYNHTNGIIEKHNIDLSKGWYLASEDETRWARAQSLSDLAYVLALKKETPRKQEEAKPPISRRIEEIHQQVREFVEKEYPEYRVTEINNHSETKYAKPLGHTAHILIRNMPEFRVYGVNTEGTKELSCDAMIDSEGNMCITRLEQYGRIG